MEFEVQYMESGDTLRRRDLNMQNYYFIMFV